MPAATATFDIVKKEATVDDTLRTIVNAINQCKHSPFVRQVVSEISKLHDPRTDKIGFIKELFSFICRNLKYQLDIPGIEEVWTPELTLREKIYDCKKGTVFIGSVLAAAGIDPIAKHVYYANPNGGLEDWTHIYIIIPESSMRTGTHTMEFNLHPYITMDTTNDCKFNTEVNHKTETLYFLNGKKMELHMMGNNNRQAAPGILNTSAFASATNYCARKLEDDMRATCKMPSRAVCGPDMIGLKNQYFSYTIPEASIHLAAMTTPVGLIMRASFLGLVALGKALSKYFKIHLAQRMALAWQKDSSKVRKIWWLFGGAAKAETLQAVIISGSGVSISGPAAELDYDRPYDLISGGMGIAPAAIPAAIVAAMPTITAFVTLFKQLGIMKEGDTDAPPPPGDPPPPPPPGGIPPGTLPPSPSAGSMMDFSSPINTIMKSVLLSTASGFMNGINFYILNAFCSFAILLSIIKIFFRK